VNTRTSAALALVWSLGTLAGCSGKSSGPTTPPTILPIKYDQRPEMSVDTPWGGWSDGTSYYTIDTTTPDGGTESWGMQAILTISPTDAAQNPGFGKASFDALVNRPDMPKNTPLLAVLHAQGQGYTNAGARLSYDINGTGEDLSMYAEGGVVFYAKVGADLASPSVITVELSTPDFRPVPARPVGVPPDTSAHCGNPGYRDCYDVPTATVQLGTDWWQYIVPFWSMRQQGTGYAVSDFYEARGLGRDPESNNGALVAFDLPKNAPFDFWIAGFGFYTKASYDQVAPH
jgi:hypothetical protein